jgi:D-arabinose 1-dehydrogenase-like Zn-dependent alcohol dehydrogenase
VSGATAGGFTPPDTMSAWRIAGFGGPDVLAKHQARVPVPTADEVLVEVSYCGVCRHDLLTRAGAFPKIPLPMTLGHQVSGVVVATGPDAIDRLGERVISSIFVGCGRCPACQSGNQAGCLTGRALFMGDDIDGGYAEYVCAPGRAFVTVPDAVPLKVAAVVSCTLGTAYHALRSRAELRAGQTVVITGASGGIGLHAVPLARMLDARVIAVTSRPEQVTVLTEHGADEVIVAPDLAFARQVKELTDGVGADAVIEVVGAPTLGQSLHAVRTGGRVVVLGNVEGGLAEVRPAHLIMKEIALLGTKSCTDAELVEVFDLVACGQVDVNITDLRPLDDAPAVHAAMESRSGNGRTVLAVSGRDPVAAAEGALS